MLQAFIRLIQSLPPKRETLQGTSRQAGRTSLRILKATSACYEMTLFIKTNSEQTTENWRIQKKVSHEDWANEWQPKKFLTQPNKNSQAYSYYTCDIDNGGKSLGWYSHICKNARTVTHDVRAGTGLHVFRECQQAEPIFYITAAIQIHKRGQK